MNIITDAGICWTNLLISSVRYPFDYGFIPNTLADDGANHIIW